MSKIEVVGLGALNMDDIHLADGILEDGETAAGPTIYPEADQKWMGTFPGGSAANTIYGLARLGVKTGFTGVIGDDDSGAEMLEDFRKAGVDTSHIKIKLGARTGSTLCLSDKLNFRSIQVRPGANSLLTLDDLDMGYINQADLLHISSFVDDAQLKMILGLVKKLDSSVRISFAPGALYATRGIEALSPILARTHVLFINQSEIRQLTGKDFSAGAEVCLKLGCQVVVVTLGQGASYKTRMATSYIRTADKVYAVELGDRSIISASDTIGAGDAFATGFFYGLLRGKELKECGRLGDITAQFSITKMGARQGLPTLNELAQRYRELYNKEL